MKKYFAILIVFQLLFFCCLASAQIKTLQNTINQLQKHFEANPVEKVYLHLDKPYYAAGDTIWFKAYTVMGAQHHLSGLSNVLNIELISSNKKQIVQRIKLQLVQGLANADFALPDTLHSGKYHIRAYTNWMRNAGKEYFFDKHFTIVNASANKLSTVSTTTRQTGGYNHTDVTKDTPVNVISSKVDVQFFPESGNLINSITSKVAFKAINNNGLAADIKGTITDEKDQVVTQFTSTHLGMGSFMLSPLKGKTYSANIICADGTTLKLELPKALEKGHTMAIDAETDPLNIIVKINSAGYNAQFGDIILLAHCGGETFMKGQGSLRASFRALIPRDKLPSGIVQFTLLSDTGEPLNERLVFVQHPDNLQVAVNNMKQSYSPMEKVSLNLSAKNKLGKAIQGNFSIAVINESNVPFDETMESTIYTNLLLTSDLKGHIEKPNYYFIDFKKTYDDLDLLMLTQGYHRLEWKQITRDSTLSAKYQPEKKLTIAGQVYAGNKPAGQSKIRLLSTSNGFFAADTLTDEQGRFAFNLDYADGDRFSLKVIKSKSDNAYIKLDNDTPDIDNDITDVFLIDDKILPFVESSRRKHEQDVKFHLTSQSTILNEVRIKAKNKSEKALVRANAVAYSSNLNGKGNADQVVTSADLEGRGCYRLAECLQGALTGVNFIASGRPYLLNSFTSAKHPGVIERLPMLVVLDGSDINLDGGTTLDQYVKINEISSIEVLRSGSLASLYGTKGGGGVLIITTKHGDSFIKEKKEAPANITPIGYYKGHEFYSPRYNVVEGKNNQPLDLRTTIYWTPVVITNENGEATLEYFNADTTGTYRVIIEGIDGEGNITHQTYRYNVFKK